MLQRLLIASIVSGVALLCACQTTSSRAGDNARSAGPPTKGEFHAGWANLRTGMMADEVLGVLGSPTDVRVNSGLTYWYYSDRGDTGPHVYFDTRPMKLLGWREP